MKGSKKVKSNMVVTTVRRRKKAVPNLSTEGYVSTLQVADMMGVSTLSIQRWFDAGLLAGARLPGGKRMIEIAKLNEFFAKQGIKVPEKAGRGKPVVLLVDDEKTLLAQMEAFLEISGRWIVHKATNTLEAGAKLMEIKPDCIVVDVMLDDVGGAALVKQIRSTSAGKSIRIVAISGRASAKEIDHIMKAGADVSLTKPFQMKELETAISSGFNFVARHG